MGVLTTLRSVAPQNSAFPLQEDRERKGKKGRTLLFKCSYPYLQWKRFLQKDLVIPSSPWADRNSSHQLRAIPHEEAKLEHTHSGTSCRDHQHPCQALLLISVTEDLVHQSLDALHQEDLKDEPQMWSQQRGSSAREYQDNTAVAQASIPRLPLSASLSHTLQFNTPHSLRRTPKPNSFPANHPEPLSPRLVAPHATDNTPLAMHLRPPWDSTPCLHPCPWALLVSHQSSTLLPARSTDSSPPGDRPLLGTEVPWSSPQTALTFLLCSGFTQSPWKRLVEEGSCQVRVSEKTFRRSVPCCRFSPCSYCTGTYPRLE